MLYLNLCKLRQMKHNAPIKSIVVKLMFSLELNSGCCVDMLNLQLHRNREYKFLIVFLDHLAKFAWLQPIKSTAVEEAAYHLFQIFITYGAPAILPQMMLRIHLMTHI